MDEVGLSKMVYDVDIKLDSIVRNLAKMDKDMAASFSSALKSTKTYVDSVEKKLSSIGGESLRGLTANLGPLGGVLSSLGPEMLGVAAAAGAVAFALKDGVEASARYEQSLRTVDGVLRATGYAAGLTRQEVVGMAEGISERTNQTREDMLGAAAELLTFRNVASDSFGTVLGLAADMSAVFGGDVRSAVLQLGKALDDPATGMTALRRIGIDFSPVQKEIIKNFEETGDAADAERVIIKAVAEQVGGAGSAAHAGLAGASHDLSESLEKLAADFATTSGAAGAFAKFLGVAAAGIDALDAKVKGFSWGQLGSFFGFSNAGTKSWSFDPLAIFQNIGRAVGIGQGAPTGDWSGSVGHIGGPNDPAIEGPRRARAEAIEETVGALRDFRKSLQETNDELRKPKRQQAIDKELDEAAKKVGLSRKGLLDDPAYADQVKAITELAGADYDLENALKAGAKAAKDAARAAEELATARAKGWKLVQELQEQADGKNANVFGARREAAIQEAVGKLPSLSANPLSPDFYEQVAQMAAASQAAGRKYDNAGMSDVLKRGDELAESFKRQAETMGMTASEAEAYGYMLSSIVSLTDQNIVVGDKEIQQLREKAGLIAQNVQAQEDANDNMRAANEVIASLRSGIDNMADTLVQAFGERGADRARMLRDAAHQFLTSLAESVLKAGVLNPAENMLLGKPGHPGGLVGGDIASLFGANAGAKPDGSESDPYHVVMQGSGGGGGSGAPLPIGNPADYAPGGPLGEPMNLIAGMPNVSGGGSSGFFGNALSWIGNLFGAAGGMRSVPGAGSNKGDGVLVRLSPKERVFDADTATKNAGLLDLIEAGHPLSGLPGFAGGSSGIARVPSLRQAPALTRGGPSLALSNHFHIDAKGAELGVEDRITQKIAEAWPAITADALAKMTRQFPFVLKQTLDTHG